MESGGLRSKGLTPEKVAGLFTFVKVSRILNHEKMSKQGHKNCGMYYIPNKSRANEETGSCAIPGLT